jgi:tetratricopeptide (TPR) repeat protein
VIGVLVVFFGLALVGAHALEPAGQAARSVPAASRSAAAQGASSEPLRTRAFDLAYNLDYEAAVALLEEGARRAPDDPTIFRALATIHWLRVLAERGSVNVDDYLGGLSRQTVRLPPPRRDLAGAFHRDARRALDLAERALAANRRSAQYEIGVTVGLMASYTATVEGKVLAGVRQARRAFDAHEAVLEIDPARKDAGLVVGTYRYLVGSAAWPLRWMAYLAGFGGDRALGLRMVEEAAAYRSDSQVEARFALVLLYNREKRYRDAIAELAWLQERFPRNRLLWLEAGSTALRGDLAREAMRHFEAGFAKLAADARPRVRGEEALWYHKRGLAHQALGDTRRAIADFGRVLESAPRAWVRGRTETALARLALAGGRPTEALERLRRAASLCEGDNDPQGEREARDLARTIPAGDGAPR